MLEILADLEPFDWNVQEVELNINRVLKPMQKDEEDGLYEGEWIGQNKDGRGVYKWANGSRYDGFWKNNKNHGFGRLVSVNGDIYEG